MKRFLRAAGLWGLLLAGVLLLTEPGRNTANAYLQQLSLTLSNAVLPAARTNLGAWPQVSAVKDLGFVGDGVTDNNSKLTTLFARTDSPTVYFDPGIYMIGCPASLSAASNISLIGAGIGGTTSGGSNTGGTVLRFSAGCTVTADVFVWAALSGFSITGYGIEIAHLTIDGQGATASGAVKGVIVFTQVHDSRIHDTAIINFVAPSIDLIEVGASSGGTARIMIDHNYLAMLNSVTAATFWNNGSGGTPGNCTVTGTTGTASTAPGPAGNLFQANVTIGGGGTITAINSVSRAGLYQINPTNTNQEPVTGCGLVGAQLQLTMANNSQNQGILVTNAGGGGISNIFVHNNTLLNTATDFDGHDIFFAQNDVSGWGYGAGFTGEASTNAHDLVVRDNDFHDSVFQVDSGGYAPGGAETWGSPDTSFIGNTCRNLWGACVDNASSRALVANNRAYRVGQRGIPPISATTCAFAGRYQDATYNSNNSTYVGNYDSDDLANLKYGYCDQSASLTGITLIGNNFSGATGALNILGSAPVIDAQSQGLKSVGMLGTDNNGKQIAQSLTANSFLTGNTTSVPNAVAITGLAKGNGASAPTAYGGTSCTNQFPRSLDLNGAATCASVANADLAGSIAASKLLARANNQTNVATPSGTTNTTGVMMGLAGALTPTFSGNILLVISGDISSNTTGDGAKVQASFGTGTAPTNGAAITGTQCGGRPTFTALTGLLTVPFSINCMITGQTLATALWIDVTLAAITGGTATISNVSISATEE